jgi:hypothetical protein
MNNTGLQKLRERGYDAVADEIAKSTQVWDDWFKGSRTSLVEKYLNGKLGIHLHVSVGVDGLTGPPSNYCINFQSRRGNVDDGDTAPVSAISGPPHCHALPPIVGATFGGMSGNDGRKVAVLVPAMEIVDMPEGLQEIVIPSVVRLHRLDEILGVWCDASDFAIPIFRLVLGEDWKLRSSDLGIIHAGSEFHRESQGQVIECGPQIEQAVASDDI